MRLVSLCSLYCMIIENVNNNYHEKLKAFSMYNELGRIKENNHSNNKKKSNNTGLLTISQRSKNCKETQKVEKEKRNNEKEDFLFFGLSLCLSQARTFKLKLSMRLKWFSNASEIQRSVNNETMKRKMAL